MFIQPQFYDINGEILKINNMEFKLIKFDHFNTFAVFILKKNMS